MVLENIVFQKSGIQAWIGYGIGKTLVMARQHAAESFEAAQKEKKSFLMKEDEVLTGPLGSGKNDEICGRGSCFSTGGGCADRAFCQHHSEDLCGGRMAGKMTR